MSGYMQDLEDCYPTCYLSSPSDLSFSEPHHGQFHGTEVTPAQQKEFQVDHVKDEVKEQVSIDLSTERLSLTKKNAKGRKQVAVISPSVLEQTPVSQRRKRTVYNQDQLDILEEFFQTNMYPDIHHREELAKRIYIPESRIQVWFQNRRGKARREKSKSSNFNGFYPNVRQPVNNIYSPASTLNRSMTGSEQHLALMPQQRDHPMRPLQQEMFQHSSDSMPYPSYSSKMSRERFLVHQASPGYHSGNQQHLYNNMASIMNTKAVDLSCRPSQMATQPNCMMDYNSFPPNKTITPDMNVTIPAIPMGTASTGHNGMTSITGPSAYHRSPIQEEDFYKQRSTDSGIVNRSMESGSGPKEGISPILCSL